MSEFLSISQARKLVLLSQGLPPSKPTGTAKEATLSAIERLGYVQIDTISVVERAHHHTLWNRNPRYEACQLSHLVEDKRVFEYWAHAAAYLPMKDYRFSLPRKQAIASGAYNHWYDRNDKLMKSVLERICAEGPLMSKDFEHIGKRGGEWSSKPAKQALESLFMQGTLMVPRRANFHKVYDLTERVLPNWVDTTLPAPAEYARFLIIRYLRANGLGQPAQIAYLLKGTKPLVAVTLQDMVASGEVLALDVDNQVYYALPDSMALLDNSLSRRKLKILSPFDNLVIQRKRMQSLFDFDYLLECYLPAAKRQYGYFSLPVLWDGKLCARMDCKADRKQAMLHIFHLALEPGLTRAEEFNRALDIELRSFMRFNGCTRIKLHRTSPRSVFSTLQTTVASFADE